tara:strand:- start:48 stop:986 length:939 start_codon:yes stop_codon:yes gene_type:complete
MISSRLQKFKKVKPGLYNFRCNICGDSKRNKSKTRGYFYQVKNNTNYKCHNCGINISFFNFLKDFDPNIYKQYIFEKFKKDPVQQKEEPEFHFEKPIFRTKLNLPKASENELSKKYLEDRKLDPDLFFYADKFKSWTNTIKQTFEDLRYDEPRIVIPLFYNKELVGFQGRTLDSNLIKYITIMIKENAPKIYGLDKIQKDKTIYVTEGPFDSTFIPNSIALCGADGDIDKWISGDLVWIYDNEPRNSEIVSRISSIIEMGRKVVIWPSSINKKDINDLILSGFDTQQLMKTIKSHTYNGLEAKLKFTNWKKI